MKRSESELDNAVRMTYSVKQDSAGLDIVIQMDHQRITWQALQGRFLGLREVQVVREQTGGDSQQGLVKDVNYSGGSRGGSSKQIRMASACGPMRPLG